ncbi:polysaccharide pyruvyl transferase family protein [Clostridium perfringens]
MNINIITMHRVFNYGSVLQTYALSTYLEKQGHNVKIIDYIPERFKIKNVITYVNPKRNKSILHKVAFIIAALPGRLLHKNIFENFIDKNYKVTKEKYYNIDELKLNIPEADIYITGSDQVWNSGFENRVDKAYFLDFVPPNKKKIAYSSSFGKDKLDDYEVSEIKKMLDKYNYISVREDSGLNILRNIGIKDAIQVIDPTLLLDKDEWDKKASSRLIKEKYLLIYQLNPNKDIIKYANIIAREKKLKVAKFGWDYFKSSNIDINLNYKKPEDFLSAIKNAEFIVTDSFHGTIFSLKFNKKFICVAPPKYAGRLDSILRKVNLEDRMINGNLNVENVYKNIDYKKINIILKDEKIKAEKYLIDAINN